MIQDETTKIIFDLLKIYDKLINLEDLKLELKSYIKYKRMNEKISWKDLIYWLKSSVKKI